MSWSETYRSIPTAPADGADQPQVLSTQFWPSADRPYRVRVLLEGMADGDRHGDKVLGVAELTPEQMLALRNQLDSDIQLLAQHGRLVDARPGAGGTAGPKPKPLRGSMLSRLEMGFQVLGEASVPAEEKMDEMTTADFERLREHNEAMEGPLALSPESERWPIKDDPGELPDFRPLGTVTSKDLESGAVRKYLEKHYSKPQPVYHVVERGAEKSLRGGGLAALDEDGALARILTIVRKEDPTLACLALGLHRPETIVDGPNAGGAYCIDCHALI